MRSACWIVLFLSLSTHVAADEPNVDSLISLIYSGNVTDPVEMYTHLCEIAYASDATDTKLKYSEQAIQLAEEFELDVGWPNIIRGNAYLNSDQPVSALECFMVAEEYYEGMDNRIGLGAAYSAIANVYNAKEFYGTEQYYLNMAIDIFSEEGDSERLASASHNLGYSYYKSGDYDQALEIFTKTGTIFQDQGYLIEYAYCLGNSGLVYSKQSEFEKAGDCLYRAIEMLNRESDDYAVTEYLIEYANVLQAQGDIDQAIGYAKKGLTQASVNGYINFERDAVKSLAGLYQASGNEDSTFRYQTLYIAIDDSVSRRNYANIQQMADLWTDFVVADTQDRLDASEREGTVRLIIIGGLAVILLMAVGFIVQYNLSLKRTRKLAASLEERGVLLEKQSKELEEQKEVLMQQKEELQVTLENLRKTQEQLVESEKMAAVGGLVAGVAHEMNTPVGVGITAVTNLQDEVNRMSALFKKGKVDGDELNGFLESAKVIAGLIQKNLEKAATLVQSFTQISTDQVTEQQRVFACKDYLNDIVTSFRPRFSGKKIRVQINCDEELNLNSYPGVYAQIFTNLLSNSLQHGFYKKDKGTITLNVEQDKESLTIRYSDDGAGISKKDLHRIFEPFYTSDQHRGTGLGLNIIYNLVKQKLHGNIACESEPGKGVTFTITVPNYT